MRTEIGQSSSLVQVELKTDIFKCAEKVTLLFLTTIRYLKHLFGDAKYEPHKYIASLVKTIRCLKERNLFIGS